VKQGCPLSQLLFNLCLKPLLQAVKKECGKCGTFVDPNEDRIEFTIQVYADDVIFISRKAQGIAKMFGALERFIDLSKMEVNMKKCTTSSYLIDTNQR
jgi:hypothetical protein